MKAILCSRSYGATVALKVLRAAVNFANHPKVRIDRLAGAISIAGKAGTFNSRCWPYDPANMARILGKRGPQECLRDEGRRLLIVHTGPEAQDVGIVVLSRQGRRFDIPAQRRTHTQHLVRGDLLTVS